jgi:hypothetical protein
MACHCGYHVPRCRSRGCRKRRCGGSHRARPASPAARRAYQHLARARRPAGPVDLAQERARSSEIIAVFHDHHDRAAGLRGRLVQVPRADAVLARFTRDHPRDCPAGDQGGSGDLLNGAIAVPGVVRPQPKRVQGVAQRRGVSHPASDSMTLMSAVVMT